MKDSEFIQLINLYLDHEISAADSARLEAEVQINPARREIYQQYCRMQKACKVLAKEFQTEAAPAPERKVIDFKSAARPARAPGIFTASAIAGLAACVAVIFVARSRQQPGPTEHGQQLAQQMPHASRAAQPAAATPTPLDAVARVTAQPVLVGTSLSLAGNAQADAMRVAAVEQANTQFDWMRQMRFAPVPSVPMDELRFEARPASLQIDPRTFRSVRPVDATVEMTAFRFQR